MASRTSSQVGKRLRRHSKARSRLVSLVFWERMVETSSSTAGSGLRQVGCP